MVWCAEFQLFTMILITIYCTPAEATHSAHIQSSGV